MDTTIAARWAGGLIFVNVAGTISAVVAWVVVGGRAALIVYGLTFALTALLVLSGMSSATHRTSRVASVSDVRLARRSPAGSAG
jgi:hypothetical protein